MARIKSYPLLFVGQEVAHALTNESGILSGRFLFWGRVSMLITRNMTVGTTQMQVLVQVVRHVWYPLALLRPDKTPDTSVVSAVWAKRTLEEIGNAWESYLATPVAERDTELVYAAINRGMRELE